MPAKDESGRVITKDRNLPSNPGSKISKDLYKQPKHMIDPYDRKDLMASQEKKLSQSKMMDGIFRSMSHGNIAFGNDRKSYGIDQEGEMMLQKKKLFVEAVPRVFAH